MEIPCGYSEVTRRIARAAQFISVYAFSIVSYLYFAWSLLSQISKKWRRKERVRRDWARSILHACCVTFILIDFCKRLEKKIAEWNTGGGGNNVKRRKKRKRLWILKKNGLFIFRAISHLWRARDNAKLKDETICRDFSWNLFISHTLPVVVFDWPDFLASFPLISGDVLPIYLANEKTCWISDSQCRSYCVSLHLCYFNDMRACQNRVDISRHVIPTVNLEAR